MTNIAAGEGTPTPEPPSRTVDPQADDVAEGGTVAAVQHAERPNALPAAPRALSPVQGRTGGVQGVYTPGVQAAEVYTPNRLPTEVARTVMERAWWQGLSLGQAARLSTRSRSRVQAVYAAMEVKHGPRPVIGRALKLVPEPAGPAWATPVYVARHDPGSPIDGARITLRGAQRMIEALSRAIDGEIGARWENLAMAGYPQSWVYMTGEIGSAAEVYGTVEQVDVITEEGI